MPVTYGLFVVLMALSSTAAESLKYNGRGIFCLTHVTTDGGRGKSEQRVGAISVEVKVFNCIEFNAQDAHGEIRMWLFP